MLTANLISVKYFGEMEFWFSLVKVAALVVFLIVGIWLVATSHDIDGTTPASPTSPTTAASSPPASSRCSW